MTFNELINEHENIDEISYFDLLKCQEWKDARVIILKRDNYKCVKCNRGKTINLKSGNSDVYFYKDGENTIPSKEKLNLQVHHRLYIRNRLPWGYDEEDLETLCNICHENLHNNEDVKVYDEYKINQIKYGKCDKCAGKGYLKEYKHVESGICFKCRGYGYQLPLINLKELK